ncbi:MAG: LapA family protein [Arenibacterium sp.]
MRYVRYAILAVLVIVIVSVSLANRAVVSIKLLPQPIAEFFGFNWSMALPLFVIVLGGIAAGVMIGFIWEWIREHKHRRVASAKTREVAKLEQEVSKLKVEKNEGKDEVLAILDEAS